MRPNSFVIPLLSAALVATPVAKAAAQDALVGGIIGGIVGGLIVNEANKGRTGRSAPRAAPDPAREANRETQVALNYFAFPVGMADGALGPRSRSAMAEYQGFMGYPVTGQLNPYERDFLVRSYYRAQSGGYETQRLISTNPYGVRGLLLSYRDEGAPGVLAAAPGVPAPTAPVAAAPVAAAREAAAPVAPVPAPGLPLFYDASAASPSVASHCNRISLQTTGNGGFVTLATMTDASFALSEQFCLARNYAISQSDDLIARVAGYTPAQIAEQCKTLGPALQPAAAALGTESPAEVLRRVDDFILSTGMPAAQLAGTAKICLGVGYRTDDTPVALGSALLLTASGDTGYGELMGHHVAFGFGAAADASRALGWFDLGLGTGEGTVQTAFAPGLPDRAALVRAASNKLGGRSAALVPDVVAPPAAVPASAPGGVPQTAPSPAAVPVSVAAPAAAPAPEVAPAAPRAGQRRLAP